AAFRLWRGPEDALPPGSVGERLRRAGEMLRATRPTAVNLSWAIERMLRRADHALRDQVSSAQLAQFMLEEAQAIAAEDYEACLRMGEHGAHLIADGDTLLTHCNAGALATAGLGTALAPMYLAHKAGKRLHVFVAETRPVLHWS